MDMCSLAGIKIMCIQAHFCNKHYSLPAGNGLAMAPRI